MAKILDMPKLSPTMEEGVLSAWHKKEGDPVAVDDLLQVGGQGIVPLLADLNDNENGRLVRLRDVFRRVLIMEAAIDRQSRNGAVDGPLLNCRQHIAQ